MCCVYGVAKAHPPEPPESTSSLLQTIARSHLIVVGRLTKITPDATRHPTVNSESPWKTLNLPGEYTFHVTSVWRGKCDLTLRVDLPQLSSAAYGGAVIPVSVGKPYLLLLEPERDKQVTRWIAADPIHALLPLIDDEKTWNGRTKKNIVVDVIDLLIKSFSDSMLGCANSCTLRYTTHPYLAQALAPYMDSPNLDIQASVLTCMAMNQQPQAIPRIARLESRADRGNFTVNMAMTLSLYKTPDAVRFLNPLLFDVSPYIRINTVMVLRDLADGTSIPYLVAALHDPDVDVSYIAYATLCRLIPSLGPSKTTPEYEKHQQEILKPVYAWWHDELNGDHLPPAK